MIAQFPSRWRVFFAVVARRVVAAHRTAEPETPAFAGFR
jgi:hypothetical protein